MVIIHKSSLKEIYSNISLNNMTREIEKILKFRNSI